MSVFDQASELAAMNTGSLLEAYRNALANGPKQRLQLVEAELWRRLDHWKHDTGTVIVPKDLEYPGNPAKEHPFEKQLRSQAIRDQLRKDQVLAVSLFSNLCGHLLVRARFLADIQLDFMVDVYSASPYRISSVLAKTIGIKRSAYFSDNPKIPQGRDMPVAQQLLARLGWLAIRTDKPPLLERERDATEELEPAPPPRAVPKPVPAPVNGPGSGGANQATTGGTGEKARLRIVRDKGRGDLPLL